MVLTSGVDDGAVCRSEDIALTGMCVCVDCSDADCSRFPLYPKPSRIGMCVERLIAALLRMEALVALGI